MNKIRPFMDKNIIKVLTGIKRSGKSIMLKLIQEELILAGIKQNQIMTINFEDMENEHLTEASKRHEVVMAKYEENPE